MSNLQASRAQLGAKIGKLIQRLKSVRLRRAHAVQQEIARHQAQERLQVLNLESQFKAALPEQR
jgi:hypothetical protein